MQRMITEIAEREFALANSGEGQWRVHGMSSENRASALGMLKALARTIIEELQYDGKPVVPAEVAARAMYGYRDTPDDAAERRAIRRELEDHVRELLAQPRD